MNFDGVMGEASVLKRKANIDINLRLITLLSSLMVFVFVEVLQPSQPNGVMLSTVSLPNHTFTGQA